MALLAAESLDFGYGHSINPEGGKSLFNVFEFIRSDDCFDFLHVRLYQPRLNYKAEED